MLSASLEDELRDARTSGTTSTTATAQAAQSSAATMLIQKNVA
jgi:hypothetical protein